MKAPGPAALGDEVPDGTRMEEDRTRVRYQSNRSGRGYKQPGMTKDRCRGGT